MALAVKAIPTLYGEEAREFRDRADDVESYASRETFEALSGSFDRSFGCRFIIVDAKNTPEVKHFYEKNGLYVSIIP